MRAKAGATSNELRLYLSNLSQTGSDERLLRIDINHWHCWGIVLDLGVIPVQDGDCLPVAAFGRCKDPVSLVRPSTEACKRRG